MTMMKKIGKNGRLEVRRMIVTAVVDGLTLRVMTNMASRFSVRKKMNRNRRLPKSTQVLLSLQLQRYPIIDPANEILTPADLAKLEELRAKAIVDGPTRKVAPKKGEKYTLPMLR